MTFRFRTIVVGLIGLLSPLLTNAAEVGAIDGTLKGIGPGPFVIWVESAPGKLPPPPTEPVRMDQKNNVFLPHILPMVLGGKAAFETHDPELHNIYARHLRSNNVLFNLAQPPGAPALVQTMSRPGVVKITCNVHPQMLAWIIVVPNEHFVMTNPSETKFHLDGVPVGDQKIRVWGEKLDSDVSSKIFSVTVGPTIPASLVITKTE